MKQANWPHPSKVYIKGLRINPKSDKLSENNVWIIDVPSPQDISVNNQLHALLDILEPRIPVLRGICQKYYCEISCAIYMYIGESTPWLHFDNRYNELIKELNIEFDLHLYALNQQSQQTIDA